VSLNDLSYLIHRSGDIDADELAEVLRSLGQKPSKEDVDEMIKEAAADGEGTDATAITFDQFLNLMADPTRSFAQSFANQQAMMAKHLGSNIKVLKQ
jgi:Ca2+-binding EF-hand superfamily protein